jgi:hypothetical protein
MLGSITSAITSVSDLEASLTEGISDSYEANDKSLDVGDIVPLSTTTEGEIVKASKNSLPLGVVSNNSGLVLDKNEDELPVAQVGKVHVKVNMEGE